MSSTSSSAPLSKGREPTEEVKWLRHYANGRHSLLEDERKKSTWIPEEDIKWLGMTIYAVDLKEKDGFLPKFHQFMVDVDKILFQEVESRIPEIEDETRKFTTVSELADRKIQLITSTRQLSEQVDGHADKILTEYGKIVKTSQQNQYLVLRSKLLQRIQADTLKEFSETDLKILKKMGYCNKGFLRHSLTAFHKQTLKAWELLDALDDVWVERSARRDDVEKRFNVIKDAAKPVNKGMIKHRVGKAPNHIASEQAYQQRDISEPLKESKHRAKDSFRKSLQGMALEVNWLACGAKIVKKNDEKRYPLHFDYAEKKREALINEAISLRQSLVNCRKEFRTLKNNIEIDDGGNYKVLPSYRSLYLQHHKVYNPHSDTLLRIEPKLQELKRLYLGAVLPDSIAETLQSMGLIDAITFRDHYNRFQAWGEKSLPFLMPVKVENCDDNEAEVKTTETLDQLHAEIEQLTHAIRYQYDWLKYCETYGKPWLGQFTWWRTVQGNTLINQPRKGEAQSVVDELNARIAPDDGDSESATDMNLGNDTTVTWIEED